MNTRTILCSCVLALANTGCAREATTIADAIPSPETNASGQTYRQMANCPSAVPGAQTTVTSLSDGVAIEIVGPDDDAARAIRQRAHYEAQIHPVDQQPIRHTGRGTGGGATGYCPIVHPGTYVTVEDIPGGARVIVTARNPNEVEALRQVTEARLAAMRARAGQTAR